MEHQEGFPPGLWWVRWVDDVAVPAHDTGTPSVTVLLSPLPEGTVLDRLPDLASQAGSGGSGAAATGKPASGDDARRPGAAVRDERPQVLAGMIPGLAIGTVFWDGWRVAQLPAREETFVFSKLGGHRFHRADGALAGRYPLAGFGRSNVVALQDGDRTLLLPCFEAFRSFYAPEQAIAAALLSGLPWASPEVSAADEVLNTDLTKALPDGTWMIVLRAEIRNRNAHVLANLWLTERGREAANRIHTALVADRQAGRKAMLRVLIPFDWDRLEVTVRCVLLEPEARRYLAVEVTRITWPDRGARPPLIVHDRDNSNRTGEDVTPADRPEPYARVAKEIVPGPDGSIPVVQRVDPVPMPPAAVLEVVGPEWLNVPPMRQAEKSLSHTYQKGAVPAGPEPLQQASPGRPGDARSAAAATRYTARPLRPAHHRFRALAELLDRLKAEGAIEDWCQALPPCGGLVFSGGIRAWPFAPGTKRARKRWAAAGLDGAQLAPGTKRARKRPAPEGLDGTPPDDRCAFVCDIQADGAKVHWLELETGAGGKGTFALLFGTGAADRDKTVHALLRTSVKKKGVWPDGPVLEAAGAKPHRKWAHRYEKGTEARLHAGSALRALRLLAAAIAASVPRAGPVKAAAGGRSPPG